MCIIKSKKHRNQHNAVEFISQIDQGADFLLYVADTFGYGVIEAVKQRGIYALGAISDQNKLAPETVLASFVLDAEKAFDQVIKSVQTGNFTGKIFKPDLESKKGRIWRRHRIHIFIP